MIHPVDEAIALIEEMLPDAERLNALLAPLAVCDPQNREEPLWNAHSMSGGVVQNLKRTWGWLLVAKREEERGQG